MRHMRHQWGRLYSGILGCSGAARLPGVAVRRVAIEVVAPSAAIGLVWQQNDTSALIHDIASYAIQEY